MASITHCISLLLIVFTAVSHTAATDVCYEWVKSVENVSSQLTTNRWSARQVIGPNNVHPAYEHNAKSWAPNSDSENEYIVVNISSTMIITGVSLFETWFSGAAVQISSLNLATGLWVELWKSTGLAPRLVENSRIFSPTLRKYYHRTNQLKITFNTKLVDIDWQWYELDAIRVQGTGVCTRWVDSVVEFSSEYSATEGWSADQVIGVPNVFPLYEDNPASWAPDPASANESIVVAYDKNVTIFSVALYETGYSGAAVQISSKNWETDSWEVLWAADEPRVVESSRRFAPRIQVKSYQTSQLKIDFNTTESLWYELDAISVSSIVCTTCASGYYASRGCTLSSDRTCTACSTCAPGRYETRPCTATTNRACAACTQCTSKQYETTRCTATTNRVCRGCTLCAANFYASSPCTATSNRVCRACSGACPAGKRLVSACTYNKDRVCAAITG